MALIDEEKQVEKEYQAFLSDVETVLKTEAGKNLIWFILSECGIYNAGFVEGEMSQFLQGKREIGVQLIGVLQDVDPRAYANLQLHMAER